jgi:hypothetical protein
MTMARPRPAARPRVVWWIAAAFAAYGAVSFTVGVRNALGPGRSQDLSAVFASARLWLKGHDPYAPYTWSEWLVRAQATVVPATNVERGGSTPYPPIALLDLAPFAAAEWPVARALWLALNVAIAVTVPWAVITLWFRHWSGAGCALLAAVWFGGIGLRVGLGNGQHALWWFACTLIALLAVQRARAGLAGAALALSLHKFTLTGPIVLLLAIKRRWRPIAAMVAVTAALLAIFVARTGHLIEMLANYRGEMDYWYGRSAAGSIAGMGATDLGPLMTQLIASPAFATALTIALIGAAAVATVLVVSRELPATALDVSIAMLLALVSTYHAVYDTVVLIVPIAALANAIVFDEDRRFAWPDTLVLAMLTAMWFADGTRVYRVFAPLDLAHVPSGGVLGVLNGLYRAGAFGALVYALIRAAARRPHARAVVRAAVA